MNKSLQTVSSRIPHDLTPRKRNLSWRVLLAFMPYLLLVAAAYSVFPVTVDDPFIAFRYAANLNAGHGLVFNVGERVEGFSSPLFVLLSALLIKLTPGGDILFDAKLLSLTFGLVTLWLTGKVARRCGLSRGEAVLTQCLVALNINFAVASVNAMETTLYTALLLASLHAFLREGQGTPGYRSALWLFAAQLARPEAFLVFLALLCVKAAQTQRLRPVLEWACFFVFPTLILLLARYGYYGQFVPNTYFAKDVDWRRGLDAGFAYLSRAFAPWSVGFRGWATLNASWTVKFQSVGAVFFWLLAGFGVFAARRRRELWPCLALLCAEVAFILRTGGDWMDGWRFLVPVLPLLTILQVYGLHLIARSVRRPALTRSLRLALGTAAAVLWTAFFALAPHQPWAAAKFSTRSRDLFAASGLLGTRWILTAEYIQTVLPKGATVAYSEVGYAAYLSLDKNFIDLHGLTDPQIAALPRRWKAPWGVSDYTWYREGSPLGDIVNQRSPDAIIIFQSYGTQPGTVWDRYYLTAQLTPTQNPPWYSYVYLTPKTISSLSGQVK